MEEMFENNFNSRNFEERKTNTITLKITMPKSVANLIKEESRIRFGDCRWLKILYDHRLANLFEAFIKNQDMDVNFHIQQMREEMKQKIKEFYTEQN